MMRVTLCALLLAGCSQQQAPAARVDGAAVNYELTCAAPSTATSAQMQCVRTDTRTGDVVVVEYMKLPVSTGSTAAGAAPAGRFQTACTAPSTSARAEFVCVRLNTETGELLLINLTKVPVFPPAS